MRSGFLIVIAFWCLRAGATPLATILETAATNHSASRAKPDPEFEAAWLLTADLVNTPRPRYTISEDRHGERAKGNPMASRLPRNARDLYEDSLPFVDGRERVSWWAAETGADDRCVFHRYQGANDEVHWNGATKRLGGSLAIQMGDVPRPLRLLLSAYRGCRR